MSRSGQFSVSAVTGRGVGVAVVRQRGLVLLWIALREHESEPPRVFERSCNRLGDLGELQESEPRQDVPTGNGKGSPHNSLNRTL